MGYDRYGFSTSRYNGIDLNEYDGWQLSDIISRQYDAKEVYERIVQLLFSKGSLDKATLEDELDTLGRLLDVKVPTEDLQIERKNDTLKNLQFHLAKVLK